MAPAANDIYVIVLNPLRHDKYSCDNELVSDNWAVHINWIQNSTIFES